MRCNEDLVDAEVARFVQQAMAQQVADPLGVPYVRLAPGGGLDLLGLDLLGLDLLGLDLLGLDLLGLDLLGLDLLGLDLLGVDYQHRKAACQAVLEGFPRHAGRFHGPMGAFGRREPLAEREQVVRHGAKRPALLRGRAWACVGVPAAPGTKRQATTDRLWIARPQHRA